MERRVALKGLAVMVAGVVFLPGCDISSKSSTEAVQSFLSPSQDQLLARIVETFIPATDTPGAEELGVHQYVKVMVADCHEAEVQKIFLKGLDTVETLAQDQFGEAYAALKPAEQTQILKSFQDSGEEKNKLFYDLVKGLTIQGYMTSEYVMTEQQGFKLVPGPHYACVPVSSKSKA